MATYSSVNERRERYWLANAIRYHWMKAFKASRNPKLWLFSAWEGQRYSDNTKYFYEYMLQNHSEIACIWQTQSTSVFQMLREEGKPVQLIGTKEATKAQKEAGVVFYTNGLDDFGASPFVYGALIVSLWHGVGFKKLYRELLTPTNRIRKAYSSAKWNFFSWVKRDITVVTSEQSKEHFIKWFDLEPSEPILITGQPRNDAFKKSIKLQDVLRNDDVVRRIANKRIILYMPTFRKESESLLYQLNDLWISDKFERLLAENNAVFLAKLHYLNKGNLESTHNKVLLNDADVVDSQELLCCAEILVTDYSSCAIDFALQMKPILFYIPDWDEYGADFCMREGTKEICSINCAETSRELENKIKDTLQDSKLGLKQSEALNQIFDDTGVFPGDYSDNLYRSLIPYVM